MLWRCDNCTTLYAVGMPRCPQCGATGHTEVDSGGQPVGPRLPQDQPGRPDEAQLELEPADQPEPATGSAPSPAVPAPGPAKTAAAKPPTEKPAGRG